MDWQQWTAHQSSLFLKMGDRRWHEMWEGKLAAMVDGAAAASAADGTATVGISALPPVVDLSIITNRSPYVVPPFFNLSLTYSMFRSVGLRHLCVVDGQTVVGVITRKDLLYFSEKGLREGSTADFDTTPTAAAAAAARRSRSNSLSEAGKQAAMMILAASSSSTANGMGSTTSAAEMGSTSASRSTTAAATSGGRIGAPRRAGVAEVRTSDGSAEPADVPAVLSASVQAPIRGSVNEESPADPLESTARPTRPRGASGFEDFFAGK